MYNLFKSELYKIRHSKIFLISYIVILLFASFSPPFVMSNGLTGHETFLCFTIIQFEKFFTMSGIFAVLFLTWDFDGSFVKNVVSFGHSRSQIILVKTAVIFILVFCLIIIPPIVSTLISSVLHGYGEIFTAATFLFIVKQLLLLFFTKFAFVCVTVLIFYIIRRVAICIVCLYILDFGIIAAQFFSDKYAFIRFFYEKTPLPLIPKVLSSTATSNELIAYILMGIVTIAASIAITIYFFRKAEIK